MSPIPLGKTPNGDLVEAYDLVLPDGCSARVISLGATITSLRMPDLNGRLDDMVLGFDTLGAYLQPHPYFGAIAGRVAGRITNARFTLDGIEHVLESNDPPNHLHGGTTGFSRCVWSATPLVRSNGAPSVRLEYHSPDGEEGYPGNVDLSVTYTLTQNHTLIVETEAVTDAATPFSLTQHSYFNLNGEQSGSTLDHEVQIHADEFAPVDENMGLRGERIPVVAGVNDFTSPRRLGEAVPHLHQNHGDLYFLPDSTGSGSLRPAARVVHPPSGRVLSVQTTEDCLQLYTGVGLDGSLTGKSGVVYDPHFGFCLECEGYPDGANHPELGDIILRPGQSHHQTTHYTFSTLSDA